MENGMLGANMVDSESFDDKAFYLYSNGVKPKVIADIPPEYENFMDNILLNQVFTEAFKEASESVDLTRAHEELVGRIKAWPAMYEHLTGPRDERWDVSSQLRMTDAYHADMMLPEMASHVAKILVAHSRIHGLAEKTDSEEGFRYMDLLKFNATEGIELTHAASRIFLAMGTRYGVQMIDAVQEEVVLKLAMVSERESLGIDPTGGSLGWALFEDMQLRGAEWPTRQSIEHFFVGVERLLQFEESAVVFEVLGLLAKTTPDLQDFSLRFYKKHKAMLFAERPVKTFQARDKLIGLLEAKLAESKTDEELSDEALKYANTFLLNRQSFLHTLSNHYRSAVERFTIPS